MKARDPIFALDSLYEGTATASTCVVSTCAILLHDTSDLAHVEDESEDSDEDEVLDVKAAEADAFRVTSSSPSSSSPPRYPVLFLLSLLLLSLPTTTWER